ncbi:MAG TPA: YihY/virulence factor BrkB family protein [Spirochaetota bacterium]|nr:YihY/virulence factor BrkB family protein [Spirochaetota bacterium]
MNRLQTISRWVQEDLWNDAILEGRSKAVRFGIIRLRMLVLEWRLFFENRVMQTAGSLSFTTILSLIPLLAVLFMMFKLFDGRNVLQTGVKPHLYTLLAPGAGEELTQAIDRMLQSASVETLGIVGVIFLFGSVYMMFFSVEEAFNKIWNVPKNRRFLDQLRSYGVILMAVPVFTILSFMVTNHVRELGESIVGGFSLFFGETLFPFFMVVLAFYTLLRVMPNCAIRGSRAWHGAVLGAVLYLVSKEVFVYYTSLAVSTNIIYGSLAALPIFFLWLFIVWIIVLYAVIVVFVRHNLEHLTALERSKGINRTDELRIGLMTAMILARDALLPGGGEPGSTVTGMASETGAPARDVRMIVERMEQARLLVRVAGKEERFMLRISPERLTMGMLLDAIDRTWLGTNTYHGETGFPVYGMLFKKNRLRRKAYRKMPLVSIIELNESMRFRMLENTPEIPASRETEGGDEG